MNFQDPAILAALEGKLGELIGKSSGYIESLPFPVKRRIGALDLLQDSHTELEKKCHAEILEIERKYEKLYAPLYEKRSMIISGKVEPTDEECGPMEGHVEEVKETTDAAAAPKGIPEFWSTALKNHPEFSELITDRDEPALGALTDVTAADLEGGQPGFSLTFQFGPNDFFTNETLTKTYYLIDEGDKELMYDHAEGTVIQWKEGKDLSFTVEVKKQRHKGTNKTRTVKKTIPADTFFSFFTPPQVPDHGHEHGEGCDHGDDDEGDEDEGEDAEIGEELEELLEADYSLGELIKEKIIPCAVDWFTGKALDDVSYYDGEDEDDYDDEDFDEDDDEDDEEDDEEAAPPAKGAKGGSKGGKGAAVAEADKPAECKQQ